MAEKNKFEAMLEKLIAEDRTGAEELFHEIVVEKSRTIYEKLLDDDMPEVDVDEAEEKDAEVDEKEDTEAKEDEKVDEKADEDEGDEQEVKEELVDITPVEDVPTEAGDEMGGDPTDAMIGDIEDAGDEEGDDEGDAGDDEDLEDRVVDLEDALDDLKSEFDSMMDDKDGDDDDGEEGPEMDMDAGDDEEGDEDGEDDADAESDLESERPAFEGKEAKANAPKDQTELMREYVNKIADEPKKGDNGANTKSPVANKNDMGGTAANIAKGGEGGGSNSGLTGNDAKEDSAGNVNVPGGKASKSLKSNSKGHGTEKKGKGEEGGTNTDSVLGS